MKPDLRDTPSGPGANDDPSSVMRAASPARYIVRRLLASLFTLVMVSIAIFLVLEVLPGDVAVIRVGQFGSEEQLETARVELGLERPIHERYVDWASSFLVGDWGESWRLQTPIAPLVLERLANSAVLALSAFVIVVPLSLVCGLIAALHRGKFVDRLISLVGLCAVAIPEFVSSMFLILTFSLWLDVLPPSASLEEGASFLSNASSLVLPVTALTLVLFGYISRMVRASMIEELESNYVRTAVLKGLSRRHVTFGHVLRNGLLPTITVIANQASWMVGGLVVIENIFNFPGLGQLLLKGALGQDVPLLEVTALILAAILMLSNFVAELLYSVLNPRVRLGQG